MKIECFLINCCFTSTPDFILKLAHAKYQFSSHIDCFDQVNIESEKRPFHGLFIWRPFMIINLLFQSCVGKLLSGFCFFLKNNIRMLNRKSLKEIWMLKHTENRVGNSTAKSSLAWKLFLPTTCSDEFCAHGKKWRRCFKTDIFAQKIRCEIFIVLKD